LQKRFFQNKGSGDFSTRGGFLPERGQGRGKESAATRRLFLWEVDYLSERGAERGKKVGSRRHLDLRGWRDPLNKYVEQVPREVLCRKGLLRRWGRIGRWNGRSLRVFYYGSYSPGAKSPRANCETFGKRFPSGKGKAYEKG